MSDVTERTESMTTELEVVKTLELAAPPARVWKAITDPEELAQWFPDEESRVRVEEGAEGAWVWKEHGAYRVRFDTVEPPRRLVWSWARDPDVPLDQTVVTTVEWRLEPNGEGGTTLHVREHGFVREEDRRQNDLGWDHELAELAAHLER